MSTLAEISNQAIKVLIAEDSPTQALQLQHILESQGYQVHAATNGRLALDATQHFVPTLVVSDVVMPEMDGYELSRRIKSDPRLRDIPVILVTTMSDPQDVIRGLECGADSFILKPFDERYLLNRIQFVIMNRRMREVEGSGPGVEIVFNGKKHFITADRLQILNLLLSTYEAAIQRNRELNRNQEELQELNAKLEAANQELESFSYSVSHDLRAPLRAIDGYSRVLEEEHGASLDDEGRRLLGVIREGSEKMDTLIEDLLAFSRLGRKPITAADTDMNVLVRGVLDGLRTTVGNVNHCVIESLPSAWCDPALLRQVWVNLLSNAFKFAGKREPPMIRVAARSDGVENVYSVSDNGAGFNMRYYEKLFGVFQRLHRNEEFPGTGVGLAIVQRIIVRHGGRVWAEGKVNEGATFYFSLPPGRLEE